MQKALNHMQRHQRTAFMSWRWIGFASLLIITSAGVILIARNFLVSDVDRGTAALIDAFSERRLIEPRLSGGFKAGEFRSSVEDMSGVKTEAFDQARELITDAAARGDLSADLAYARLLLSKSEKLPEALKYLRRAVSRTPESAEVHNDLGVCFIQQGKLEEAIDELNAALRQNPQMQEALFNRALCYEKLQLREPAGAAFVELARLERDESWLPEIKERGAKLAQPLAGEPYDAVVASLDAAFKDGRVEDLKVAVAQRLELVWHYALADLVEDYLQAAVRKDVAKAALTLQELTFLGESIGEIHGDTAVSEVVRYLKSLPENELTTELKLVSECVTTANRPGDNRATYERLHEEFKARMNTVFQALCRWYPARQLYSTNHYSESLSALKSLMPLALNQKWPVQRLLLMGQMGLALSRLGLDSLAITYFNESLALSRQLHTLEGKALQNLSLPYWHIGNFDKALSYLRDSITRTIAEGPELGALAYNYLQIADLYRLSGRPDLALLYADESLMLATQAKHLRYAAQASSLMAVEHAQLSSFQKAEKDLESAFASLNAMDQQTANAYSRPLVLTRAATVCERSGDITRALQYYDEAEKLVSTAQERRLPLLRVLRGRADALIVAGRPFEAKANLERAVEILEGYRAEIASSEDRSYFLETSQAVFDRLIALNLEQTGGEAEAFELSERSRARALLEDISSRNDQRNARNVKQPSGLRGGDESGKPVTLSAIQRQLPADLTLAEYSVTDRGTFIFVLSESGFRIARSPAISASIDQLVNDYLSNLNNPAAVKDPEARTELSRQARLLYEQLIDPIRSLVKGETRLCIVPDKSLHFLPFAALEDNTGAYLVQQYTLTYAPSASVLLQCINQAVRRRQSGPEKLLAVGNPRFAKDYFHELKDLHDSEAEALDSAGFYTQPETLTGSEATKSRVLSELDDSDVVHLASHCLVNNSSPWRAALVLASTSSNNRDSSNKSARPSPSLEENPVEAHLTELLSLAEIYQVRLPRTKLAVLSACQTGLGRYFRGEGVVSLVRPFIASGVPTVVASLWSVDSRATYELMVRFHRERTTKARGAGDALRAAQLKIMSGTFHHPYYWAAFIAVGR